MPLSTHPGSWLSANWADLSPPVHTPETHLLRRAARRTLAASVATVVVGAAGGTLVVRQWRGRGGAEAKRELSVTSEAAGRRQRGRGAATDRRKIVSGGPAQELQPARGGLPTLAADAASGFFACALQDLLTFPADTWKARYSFLGRRALRV